MPEDGASPEIDAVEGSETEETGEDLDWKKERSWERLALIAAGTATLAGFSGSPAEARNKPAIHRNEQGQIETVDTSAQQFGISKEAESFAKEHGLTFSQQMVDGKMVIAMSGNVYFLNKDKQFVSGKDYQLNFDEKNVRVELSTDDATKGQLKVVASTVVADPEVSRLAKEVHIRIFWFGKENPGDPGSRFVQLTPAQIKIQKGMRNLGRTE